MTRPTITEAERNELRKHAAVALPDGYMVPVNSAHLLDLLDCADREATLLERIELVMCGTYEVEARDALAALLKGDSHE